MKQYDEKLSRAVTAFYLPSFAAMSIDESPFGRRTNSTDAAYKLQMHLLRAIPFPCIRIIRDGEVPPDSPLAKAMTEKSRGRLPKHLRSDVVCEMRDGVFSWASKDAILYHDGYRVTKYMPEDWGAYGVGVQETALPRSYFDLMQALADRQNRYIEQKLTRQARRASGLSPTYCEYVVVRKKEAPIQEAYRWSEIVRRHPMLHAVRAHLRHYKSGLIVKVREHTRGHGELFQVKDYVLPA